MWPDHPYTLKSGCKGDVCLVGEKPDKELPGILGHVETLSRTVGTLLHGVRVVNFVLPFSQLQGVEWGWPGRREPDDEHSTAS